MNKKITVFDELSKEREGFIMRNGTSGIEIKCTEKFVQHWEKRGFSVVKKDLIHLIEE